MAGIDKLFGIHGQALQVRAARAEVLANNIANADTPGFHAKDIDFASALQEASRNVSGPNNSSFQSVIKNNLIDTPSAQGARDGNTVDSQAENVKFMQNTVQYQASLGFLNGKIRQLLTAIKGD